MKASVTVPKIVTVLSDTHSGHVSAARGQETNCGERPKWVVSGPSHEISGQPWRRRE
jgi:hypothetical protein